MPLTVMAELHGSVSSQSPSSRPRPAISQVELSLVMSSNFGDYILLAGIINRLWEACSVNVKRPRQAHNRQPLITWTQRLSDWWSLYWMKPPPSSPVCARLAIPNIAELGRSGHEGRSGGQVSRSAVPGFVRRNSCAFVLSISSLLPLSQN